MDIAKSELINILKKYDYIFVDVLKHYKLPLRSRKIRDLMEEYKIVINNELKKNGFLKKRKKQIAERKKRLGYINSLETRKKLSESLKKVIHTNEWNSKVGKRGKIPWNKGLIGIYDKEQLNEIGKNSRRRIMEQLKRNGKIITPWFNKDACNFFNKINKKYNLKGQHALNGKEFYVKGLYYWIDFYSKKYNLIIEWNEDGHYELNEYTNRYILTNKHKNRQNLIKRKLKCHWINIRQKTFKEENIFKRIEKIIRKQQLKLVA